MRGLKKLEIKRAISHGLIRIGQLRRDRVGRDRTMGTEWLNRSPRGDALMFPPHLLLVEDHTATRVTLAWLLKKKGYDVETAASGGEARLKAHNFSFDLVLSDIGLPDESGLELMSDLIKEQPGLKGIAVTALGSENDAKQIRAAGFSRHLVKPIVFQELERTIVAVHALV